MATYDLATLSEAQAFLNVSGEDDMLSRMITAATQVMERYTGRRLASRSYTEWVNGSGTDRLYLNNWPITTLSRICNGQREVARIYNTSTDAAYATVTADTSGLTLTVGGGTNDGSDTSITWASYATVADVVAAVNALGSGWYAEVLESRGSYPSAEIRPMGAGAALNNGTHGNSYVDLQAPEEPIQDVMIDVEQRYLYAPSGFNAGTLNVFAAYTAGYATTDQAYEHLTQICLEIVSRMYAKRGKGGGMRSESLDGYSYTLAAEAELQADIRAMLAPYCRVVV